MDEDSKNKNGEPWEPSGNSILTILTIGAILTGFYLLNRDKPAMNAKMESRVLTPGVMINTLPDTLVEGKTEIIQVNVYATDHYISVENQRDLNIDSVFLGDMMTVEFHDFSESRNKHFEIFNLGSSNQIIGKEYDPLWEFQLTPIKSGESRIGFKPKIIKINIGTGEGQVFDLKMITKEVFVEPNYTYRVKMFWNSNWEWSFSFLILLFPSVRKFFINIWNGIFKRKNKGAGFK